MQFKFSDLELLERALKLKSDVQLRRVEDRKNERRAVYEPAHDLVKWVAAFLLATVLDDARRVDDRDVPQQLRRHRLTAQTLQERLRLGSHVLQKVGDKMRIEI